MNDTIFGVGVACMIGAIVGGGLRACGVEFPVLTSKTRQVLLAAFGLVLIIGSLLSPRETKPVGSLGSPSPAVLQSSVRPTEPSDDSAQFAEAIRKLIAAAEDNFQSLKGPLVDNLGAGTQYELDRFDCTLLIPNFPKGIVSVAMAKPLKGSHSSCIFEIDNEVGSKADAIFAKAHAIISGVIPSSWHPRLWKGPPPERKVTYGATSDNFPHPALILEVRYDGIRLSGERKYNISLIGIGAR